MKKFKLVKQQGSSDCGAACLVSVAAHFGLDISLPPTTQYAEVDERGISLHQLIEAATSLKFDARGVRITSPSLPHVPLPAVFHLRSGEHVGHFVVLYEIKKKKVIIMDPAVGELVSVPIPEFLKFWSGAVLLLVPSETSRKSSGTQPPPTIVPV
jgi:ATP-binding cassette, subfamily C, bacteriocin exporter